MSEPTIRDWKEREAGLMKLIAEHGPDDLLIVPRAQYEALMAANKAIDGFLNYVNGQSGELYQTVYRRALDASNACRAAGIQTEESKT